MADAVIDTRLLAEVIAMLERQRDELDAKIARLREMADAASTRSPSGRWTSEDDRAALRLAGEGKKHHEIAAILGRTTLAVSQRLHRLGRAGGE